MFHKGGKRVCNKHLSVEPHGALLTLEFNQTVPLKMLKVVVFMRSIHVTGRHIRKRVLCVCVVLVDSKC